MKMAFPLRHSRSERTMLGHIRWQLRPERKETNAKPPLYGLLDLSVILADDDCEVVDLIIYYSTDGKKWLPCDPSKKVTLPKQATTPEGVLVKYTWDSFKFLGPTRAWVWFKFQVVGHNSCVSSAEIDNTVLRDDEA
jgi:hypothetical protein